MASPPLLKKLVVLGLLLLGGLMSASAADAVDLPEDGEVFVAVVLSADLPRYRRAYEAFLADLDSVPELRRRLKFFLQAPNPDPFSWENSVRRASGAGADLLLTFGTPVTLAARKAVPRMPTLYADVYDPVRLKVEKVPGSFDDNVAGVSTRLPMSTLLETYRQIAPLHKMGALYSRNDMGSVLQSEELKRLSGKMEFELLDEDVHSGNRLDRALGRLANTDIDVLYMTESPAVGLHTDKIITWSRQRRIPVIGHVPGLAKNGAILCLEADPAEQGQILSRCLRSLMSGESPACGGVHRAREVNFLVNLTVAERYDLSVPFQVLTLATRVIREGQPTGE